MTIEQIINTYPKTDDCELQTLKEVREWQISELKKREVSFAKEIVRVLDKKANKGCKYKSWIGFVNGDNEEFGTEVEKIIKKAKKIIHDRKTKSRLHRRSCGQVQ